jgi:alpha-beta hydrolase superfamily lysophospholipase
VLLLIADQNKLVVPSELVRMFAAIPSADKEVVRFTGTFHEILNEVGRQQTYQQLLTWLSAFRIGKSRRRHGPHAKECRASLWHGGCVAG